MDGTLERFHHDLVAVLETDGPLPDRLRHLTLTWFEATRSDPDLARFILALTHDPPSSAPRTDFLTFYDEILALVTRAIETAETRGEVTPGPVDVRVLVLMGALGEAVHGYLLAGRPDLTPALVDSLIDVVLKGWVHPS